MGDRFYAQAKKTKRVGSKSSVRMVGDLSLQLENFAAEVTEKALRNGGGAATEVLYNEMRSRAPEGQTHRLRESIYRYRDKNPNPGGVLKYFVGPNKRKAPHWHLIEFGHWMYYKVVVIGGKVFTLKNHKLAEPKWVPPKPFIRPTFEAKIREALETGKRRIGETVKEITSGNSAE